LHKICVKNAINGTQTFEMLQKAFGDESLSIVTVFDWHRLFKEGRELVASDYHSGRSSTSNNDDKCSKNQKCNIGNRHLTVLELSKHSGRLQGSVKTHFK